MKHGKYDRSLYFAYSKELRSPKDFSVSVKKFFTKDTDINVVHPFNKLNSRESYVDKFLLPLQHSFKDLYRRDDIVLAGKFDEQI